MPLRPFAKIIDKQLWCPMDREVAGYPDRKVQVRNCLEPPVKSVLAAMIAAEEKRRGVQVGLTEQNLPERAWLLIVLSTLNPEHAIFKKSYRPERTNAKAGADAFSQVISDRVEFFKDLPPLSRASDLKGPTRLCLTKAQRLEMQMQKASQRIEAEQQRIANIEAKKRAIESGQENSAQRGAKDEFYRRKEEQMAKELKAAQVLAYNAAAEAERVRMAAQREVEQIRQNAA